MSHSDEFSAVIPPTHVSITTQINQNIEFKQTNPIHNNSSSSAPIDNSVRFTIHPVKEELLRDLTDFVCSICSCLAYDPIETPCQHIYCSSCLQTWLNTNANSNNNQQQQRITAICPLDRQEIRSENLLPLRQTNPLAYKILGRIEVFCIGNRHLGCDWKGEYSNAIEHYTKYCAYTKIQCTQCKKLVIRKELQEHELKLCELRPNECNYCHQSFPINIHSQHLLQCDLIPMNCSNCNSIYPKKELIQHQLKECLKAKINCPLVIYGCNEKIEREELKNHMNNQAIQHVTLLAEKLEITMKKQEKLENIVILLAEKLNLNVNNLLTNNNNNIVDNSNNNTQYLERKSNTNTPSQSTTTLTHNNYNNNNFSPEQHSNNNNNNPIPNNSNNNNPATDSLVPTISEELKLILATRPPPLSSLEDQSVRIANFELTIGAFLDVRDSKGKWLEAQIIQKRNNNQIFVHYLSWSSRWDEWIDLDHESHRIQPFHYYSTSANNNSNSNNNHDDNNNNNINPYKPNETVLVYYFVPKPRHWSIGVIWKVDGSQVSVRYTVGSNVYQRWFHANSDEIAKFNYNSNNILTNNNPINANQAFYQHANSNNSPLSIVSSNNPNNNARNSNSNYRF